MINLAVTRTYRLDIAGCAALVLHLHCRNLHRILNTSGGCAYQNLERNVPLAAYDVDDPENPRRLQVGFLENNQPGGLVDGTPGDNGSFDN
ncbi:MAG: hypothetical protein R3C26_13525 [Calditrichia bacterium]